jgi:PIN domain nuclease of toxin-antitoxin system
VNSAFCFAAAAPPNHHRDPFDRLIIAPALRLNIAVVTIDPRFQECGVEIVS